MFYFLQKFPVTPLKINLPSPLWNQFYDLPQQIFY